MTTQVFVASTAFGLATVAAALDDGLFPAGQRILVTSTNAAVPEISPGPEEVAGMAGLLGRFARVYRYNDVVAPHHPALWRPRADDAPLWQRYLEGAWDLRGTDVHLVVESIQTPPALAICQALPDARIDVYADGLLSYGPTRTNLPASVAARIERLLHLDLVPGVTPLLLREHAVPAATITSDTFREVIAELVGAPGLPESPPGAIAVLLGQYLAANGFLTPVEEQDLHRDMIRGAVASGFTRLVFKPHPSTPPLAADPLCATAAELGAELTVCHQPALAESWFRSEQVGLVAGCFSTGLLTAATLYRLPTARVGTPLLLRRLRPYENSNRIPLTIVDAALPDLVGPPATAGPPITDGLEGLVRAVGYCMQPHRNADLRADTETYLASRGRLPRRYVSRDRLTELDLPGRRPPPRHPAKQAVRRLLGPGIYRNLGDVWRRLVPVPEPEPCTTPDGPRRPASDTAAPPPASGPSG